MNIDAYLKRINYRGSRVPSSETLRELQGAHLLSVPFENLSIHARKPIVLNNDALFRKIVEQRRGGFCYELNGAFGALLRELGFKVTMLSAGVAKEEGGFARDFDHMCLLIDLEEQWLCDVGFGDSFLEPLLLNETGDQVQRRRAFKIVPDGGYFIFCRRDAGDEWKPQYRFSLTPRQYADYEEMCRYHQTSPQSHFTQNRICSRATETGRITLSGMRLITTANSGEREERTLTSQEEYDALLKKHFGIVMVN